MVNHDTNKTHRETEGQTESETNERRIESERGGTRVKLFLACLGVSYTHTLTLLRLVVVQNSGCYKAEF